MKAPVKQVVAVVTREITVKSGENILNLIETDQVAPAGRWRFRADGDKIYFDRATAADWSTYETWLTFDKASEKLILGKKLDANSLEILSPGNVDGVDISAHKARHQNGGADEVGVAGLSGLLADDQHVLDAEAVAAVEAAGLALASGKNIKLISALIANQTWSGLTAVLTAGEALTIGQACYMKNDGKMWKSLATVVGTMPVVALATGTIAGDAPGEFLLLGFFREDTVFNFTAGDMLYASEDTAGALKNAAPTTSGEQVQVCGKCFPSAHIIFFCPSLELVEVS